MAAHTYYFSGEALWAKVYESNLDEWEGEKSAQIGVIMNEANMEAFKASGSRLMVRRDDRGRPYVTFKRKYVHPKIPEFGGAPEVTDADGNPFNELIGNGSKVTVRVVVYDAGKVGKGTRLEKVRVDELVVFESDAPKKVNVPEDFVGIPF